MKNPLDAGTGEHELPSVGRGNHPLLESKRMNVDVHGLSHNGLVRPNNEDRFLVCRFGRMLEVTQTNLPNSESEKRFEETGVAMVVADGIGGNAAGEVASTLAIHSLLELVLLTPDWILRLNEDYLVEEVKRRARRRALQVNQIMIDQASIHPELKGFGTTMVLACSLGSDLFLSNIGDSRAYWFQGAKLQQLTRDHTLAQELVNRGVIKPEEVSTNRFKNVLTKCLGSNDRSIDPDFVKLSIQNGDILLLCSDGLTDMVENDVISQVLASAKTSQIACENLLVHALNAGGKDNITIVVARYSCAEASTIMAEIDTTPC